MIRELMIQAVKNKGGSVELAERLLLLGEREYTTWIVHQFTDKKNVYDSLYALAEVMNKSITQMKHAYYSSARLSKDDLRKKPEYKNVLEILDKYKLSSLWLSLMRFSFMQVKKICIQDMLENDEPILEISERLCVSQDLIYRVRRDYFSRIIKQKGEFLWY